jgi:hypothetical protein
LEERERERGPLSLLLQLTFEGQRESRKRWINKWRVMMLSWLSKSNGYFQLSERDEGERERDHTNSGDYALTAFGGNLG